MRVLFVVLATFFAVGTSMVRAQCVPGVSGTNRGVKVGDLAPDFSLPGSDGRIYRLSDYRGKQAVVLVWFAKAFTGG